MIIQFALLECLYNGSPVIPGFTQGDIYINFQWELFDTPTKTQNDKFAVFIYTVACHFKCNI